MTELVNQFMITVDRQKIPAYEGESYLEAIQRAGIHLPTLCYEPELIPSGGCRLCVIEIEGMNKLVSACTTPVSRDAVVLTDTEKLNKNRQMLVELILKDHPLICTVCDKQGNCDLQKLAYEYVPKERLVRYLYQQPDKSGIDLHEQNKFFKLDYDMCIKCGKCVQAANEIQHCGVLSMVQRGVVSYPAPGFGMSFEEAGCVTCGNCLAVCPVAALVPNTLVHGGREVDSERTLTTCTYCGVGCQLELVTSKKDNRIIYGDSYRDAAANGFALCVKGRFGNDFVHHTDRIDTPYIRKNGKLVPSTWDEALDLIETKFNSIHEQHGGKAMAFLSSAKCTNEESYLMQKLARAVFKTNTVDHCARLCHASTVAGLARTFGSGAMTNSIDDLTNDAEVIFIIGSNTTVAHPIIGIKIKQAVAKGKTKVIVADPRKIEITKHSEIYMSQKPGTDLALINAILKIIIDEGLENKEFVRDRTENYDELVEIISKQDLDVLAKISGVPLEQIRQAARLYAGAKSAAIIYSMGITQHFTGTYNVGALANLAMITGNMGRPGTGVNPLRGQNNVQGACDLGALPDVYPGYQKVHLPVVKEKFERMWNTTLSDQPGLTVVEIMKAAISGEVKSLFIMGENVVLSDPNINKVRKALKSLDFLVVMDLFLTETAQYADVVLPGKSFAEKEGTFTNTERRVQMVRPAISQIGERKADWLVLNELLMRFGFEKRYNSPSDILDEIASVSPIYGGISYERIQEVGLQWPCPTPDHPGTKILHSGQFSRGKGMFLPSEFIPAAEQISEEFPLILTTGRSLYHFHTGTMTRRSKGLHEQKPYETTEINTTDAMNLGIVDGERIRISSRRGTLETIAKVTDSIVEGVCFMTFHFRESAANLLTGDTLDPIAKIPEFKVSAVRVEKI